MPVASMMRSPPADQRMRTLVTRFIQVVCAVGNQDPP